MERQRRISRQQRRAEERRETKRRRRFSDLAAGTAVALGATALVSSAQAATITVNSTEDSTVASDGKCTMREALANANSATGTDATGGDCTAGSLGLDTVDLSSLSGTITLGLPVPTPAPPGVYALYVTDSVNIQGPGAGTLSISGADTTAIFYMYAPGGPPPATPPPITVSLTGLKLEHGSSTTPGGAIRAGGFGAVNLTLNNDILENNVSESGGGAIAFFSYFGGAAYSGDLTITNTTISGNSANVAGVDGGPGGGIFVKYAGAGTDILLDHVTISNNHARNEGGGLAAALGCGATLTIQHSVISGNDAGIIEPDLPGAPYYQYFSGRGAGLFVAGYFVGPANVGGAKATSSGPVSAKNRKETSIRGVGRLAGSTLPPPRANAAVCSDVTIEDTTISGNTGDDHGAGAYLYAVNVNVQRTTVSGNMAVDSGFANYPGGGGLALSYLNGTIQNSTIANNSALYYGGGLFISSSAVTVGNTTISGNTSGAGFGGGIYVGGPAAPVGGSASSLTNSIVANDIDVDTGSGASLTVSFTDSFPADPAPTYTNGGNNLSADPLLGPLQDNGGPAQGNGGTAPTLTMMPGAGSPVIDAGNSADPLLPTTDQRGQPRLQGTAVDMGAVEVAVVGAPGTIDVAGGPAVTVNESAGTVTITLNRTNGSSGAVTVDFSTTAGTATAGADFTAVTGSVTWADGDTTPKTITIPITVDTTAEPPETFTLNLSSTTPGVIVATPAVTITIVDAAQVPTLAFWMKLMLALTCAGVGVVMLRNGRLLVVVLAAGIALTAAPNLHAAAAPRRDAMARHKPAPVAATVQEITTSGDEVSVTIGSETYRVPKQRVAVFDMSQRRKRVSLEALKKGAPVVVRARRGPDGSIRRLRVVIFDSMESANAAVKRFAGR